MSVYKGDGCFTCEDIDSYIYWRSRRGYLHLSIYEILELGYLGLTDREFVKPNWDDIKSLE